MTGVVVFSLLGLSDEQLAASGSDGVARLRLLRAIRDVGTARIALQRPEGPRAVRRSRRREGEVVRPAVVIGQDGDEQEGTL